MLRRKRQRAVQARRRRDEPDRAEHEDALDAEAIDRDAEQHATDAEGEGRQRTRFGRRRRWNREQALDQGRRHQDDHDDAGGQHPGDQHRTHHGAAVALHDDLQRQAADQLAAPAQFLEHRRFLEIAAQPDREHAEQAAEDERQAPCPGQHLVGRPARVDPGRDQRAEQDAEGQARGQRAAGKTDARVRHVLGDEDPGSRHLATDRRALQHAQQQQQQRCGDADAGVGRQQAHQQGRHRHQQHAEHEHALAPDAVAEVGHDDAAERTRQVARGEDAEGLQLAQPFGHVGRKEQLRDDRGEEDEDDEIVELKRTTECGEHQCADIAAAQRAVRVVAHGPPFWVAGRQTYTIGRRIPASAVCGARNRACPLAWLRSDFSVAGAGFFPGSEGNYEATGSIIRPLCAGPAGDGGAGRSAAVPGCDGCRLRCAFDDRHRPAVFPARRAPLARRGHRRPGPLAPAHAGPGRYLSAVPIARNQHRGLVACRAAAIRPGRWHPVPLRPALDRAVFDRIHGHCARQRRRGGLQCLAVQSARRLPCPDAGVVAVALVC